MIIIQSALQIEAKPIIEHFKLKKNVGFNSFEIFEGSEILLIISGIGKIKASAAISSAITYLISKNYSQKEINVVNFGFAGASANFDISSFYQINKIKDFETGQNFYPDLIVKNKIDKASLITFNSPVDQSTKIENSLVDMEASAFFQAASLFLCSHQIQIIKIVADHLEPEFYSKDKASKLIQTNIIQIENFISDFANFIFKNESLVTSSEKLLVNKILRDLKATKSQETKLYSEINKYKILSNNDLEKTLNTFYYEKSSNKSENKSYYNSLVQLINSSYKK